MANSKIPMFAVASRGKIQTYVDEKILQYPSYVFCKDQNTLVFIDKDLPKGEKISYYVLGTNSYTKATNKSNSEEVYLTKNYNTLINKKSERQVNNFNWLFQ